MKRNIILLITFMFSVFVNAQWTTVTTEVKANEITYIYELIPSVDFPNVHSNAYYYIRNKVNTCNVKNSGVWTDYYPRPKLQTDSSIYFQTILEVFGGLTQMTTMGDQGIDISLFIGMDGKVKEVTFIIDSASVFTQYDLESLETRIKEIFVFNYKTDFYGFDRANYIPSGMRIFPGKIAREIQGKCDSASPNYNLLECIDQTVATYYQFNSETSSLSLQEDAEISNGKLILTGGTPWDYMHPHATVPNNPSLNSQHITIAAKIKFTADFSGCGVDAIICKPYTSHTPPYYQYILGTTGTYCDCNGDHTFAFVCTINGQRYGLREYGVTWNIGEWYTVVASYNGNTMKLYVNGLLSASQDIPGSLSGFDTDLFIGKHGNVEYSIPAEIDWVKTYSRALSDSEVAALGGQ